MSTQHSNKLHSHSNCISSAGKSSLWARISAAVMGVCMCPVVHPLVHSASMENLHIWYVGGLAAAAPWSLWDIYKGVFLFATTVIDMSMIEAWACYILYSHTILYGYLLTLTNADKRHAKEKLWFKFQHVIPLPSAECLLVNGNVKCDIDSNINKWKIYVAVS